MAEGRSRYSRQPGLEVPHDGLEYGIKPTYPEPVTQRYAPHDIASAKELPAMPQWTYYKTSKRKRRICGLRVATFWLTLALVTLIILGAALGGGVGGTIRRDQSRDASRKASSSDATATTLTFTTTSSATSAPSSTTSPTTSPTAQSSTDSKTPAYGISDCPHSNGTIYQDKVHGMSGPYLKLCSSYFVQTTVKNLVNGPTATFDDCILMCDTLRIWNETAYSMTGVVYNPDGHNFMPPGTCFCVNESDLTVESDDFHHVAIVASNGTGDDKRKK